MFVSISLEFEKQVFMRPKGTYWCSLSIGYLPGAEAERKEHRKNKSVRILTLLLIYFNAELCYE